MNYGYPELDSNNHLELKPENEFFRYAIQLYNHVIENIALQDNDILKMGY